MTTGSGPLQQVRVGTARQFILDGDRTVTRVEEHEVLTLAVGAEIFAVGNRCTHLPVQLRRAPVLTGTCEIVCPLHRGTYSLRTGEPTQPPCEVSLPSYTVEIRGADVYVLLPTNAVQPAQIQHEIPTGQAAAQPERPEASAL